MFLKLGLDLLRSIAGGDDVGVVRSEGDPLGNCQGVEALRRLTLGTFLMDTKLIGSKSSIELMRDVVVGVDLVGEADAPFQQLNGSGQDVHDLVIAHDKRRSNPVVGFIAFSVLRSIEGFDEGSKVCL